MAETKSLVVGFDASSIERMMAKEVESHRKELAYVEQQKHAEQVKLDAVREQHGKLVEERDYVLRELTTLKDGLAKTKADLAAHQAHALKNLQKQEAASNLAKDAAYQAKEAAEASERAARAAHNRVKGVQEDSVRALTASKLTILKAIEVAEQELAKG